MIDLAYVLSTGVEGHVVLNGKFALSQACLILRKS